MITKNYKLLLIFIGVAVLAFICFLIYFFNIIPNNKPPYCDEDNPDHVTLTYAKQDLNDNKQDFIRMAEIIYSKDYYYSIQITYNEDRPGFVADEYLEYYTDTEIDFIKTFLEERNVKLFGIYLTKDGEVEFVYYHQISVMYYDEEFWTHELPCNKLRLGEQPIPT